MQRLRLRVFRAWNCIKYCTTTTQRYFPCRSENKWIFNWWFNTPLSCWFWIWQIFTTEWNLRRGLEHNSGLHSIIKTGALCNVVRSIAKRWNFIDFYLDWLTHLRFTQSPFCPIFLTFPPLLPPPGGAGFLSKHKQSAFSSSIFTKDLKEWNFKVRCHGCCTRECAK